jgi:glycosyltransferase involved in cell wall biosynthesis
MKLSVIIPCLNAAATVAAQLEALTKQEWDQPWEVIVADNGSTDQSIRIVEQYRKKLPHLTVINAGDRRGQAHARNAGASGAKAEALAFLDADDEVAPGWVRAMGEALSKHDFVACRIDFNKLNPVWAREIFQDHPQSNNGLLKAWFPPHLEHAGGCTIGVKKSIHEAIGGFDEALLIHEDTDYCFRIQRLGIKLNLVPHAVVHVRCRTSLAPLMHQAFIWSEYTVLLYKRYRPLGTRELWRWKSFFRQCRNLFFSLPDLRSKRYRALWMWNFAWQLGRLSGSIKHRVPPV